MRIRNADMQWPKEARRPNGVRLKVSGTVPGFGIPPLGGQSSESPQVPEKVADHPHKGEAPNLTDAFNPARSKAENTGGRDRASDFGLLSGFDIRISDLPAAAFTLIELVISAALMAMILTASYLCLSAALSAQNLI